MTERRTHYWRELKFAFQWGHLLVVSMLFVCFRPPSLCGFSRNLTPLLRSEDFRPHFRSLFPALFPALAAHLLHDFRNQIGIHVLDCTGQAPILPMNGP